MRFCVVRKKILRSAQNDRVGGRMTGYENCGFHEEMQAKAWATCAVKHCAFHLLWNSLASDVSKFPPVLR